MSEPGSGAIAVVTRISGLLAVAACGLLVWAVLSSIGVPRFSIGRYFISELAVPHNPAAARLNQSFMAAGAMAFPMMILLAGRARWPATRGAAIAGAVAAVALSLVGVFPLSRSNMHIHNALATSLALASVASGILLTRGLGRELRHAEIEGARKLILRGGRTLAWLQLMCVLAGVAILAWATIRAAPSSISEWWRALPRHLYVRRGQTWINPLAFLEWIYFGVTTGLLLGVGAFTVLRRSRPALGAGAGLGAGPGEP